MLSSLPIDGRSMKRASFILFFFTHNPVYLSETLDLQGLLLGFSPQQTWSQISHLLEGFGST